jgi:large subunit ribosomal protein L19
MKAVMAGVNVSPVNMDERKSLGIKAGDTVRVHQKIQDKGKTRIQIFEGLVLSRKHGNEPGATFTVRKVASGVGVEKIFPLYSPLIDKLEIVKRAKVRRSKLYYIREKVNREIKRQMRRMSLVNMATESGAEAAQREAEEAKKAEEEAARVAEEEAKKAEEAAENEDESADEKATEEANDDTPAEEQAEESQDNTTEDSEEAKPEAEEVEETEAKTEESEPEKKD